jgi:hypothetical protein
MKSIIAAKQVIATLCWDRVVKKGKKLTKLANDAPAPSVTNSAGMAQQIKVEDDKNNEIKFDDFTFITMLYKVKTSKLVAF